MPARSSKRSRRCSTSEAPSASRLGIPLSCSSPTCEQARDSQTKWRAFQQTFAADNDGTLDSRANWRDGYGMAIYWEPLVRWMTQRARQDPLLLNELLVYVQSWDECSGFEPEQRARLLTVEQLA